MTTLPLPPKADELSAPIMFYGKPLVFNPKRHMYFWDGQHVPSVTTILRRLDKPMLVQWAADCAVDHMEAQLDKCVGQVLTGIELAAAREGGRTAHANIRDTAGDVGTLVHDYAQAILENKEPPKVELPEQPTKAIAAFHDWHKQHKVEPIAVERRVMSKQGMYAGKCDFYGRIDGQLAILDFKTGNGVYDEAWYQMSGYEGAIREEMGAEYLGTMDHWLIHLNKNTGECTPYQRKAGLEIQLASNIWETLLKLDTQIRLMPKMKQPKRKAA